MCVCVCVCLEIDKLILKFKRKHNRPGIAKGFLKKKNKFGGLTLSDFRSYCKVIRMKQWGIDMQMDQQNRICVLDAYNATPSNAGGAGSTPGWGAQIPHASWPENPNIKQTTLTLQKQKQWRL